MDKNEFRDKLATGRLTRRAFTKTLGAVGLGMVTMPLIPRMARASEQALNFTWGGYELPGFYPRYIEKHGTSPDFSLFGDEDEALAKVMAGYRPDLSHPCSPLTKKWRDAGLIQAIDTSRLSDWPDVFPMLKTLTHTQYEGEQWFMPWDWGQTSITYRTDLVDIEEESYGLLWDERYKGRLAVIDAAGDTVWITALYAGIDPLSMSTHVSDEEIARLKELLVQQKPLLRMYSNDLTTVEQALASGELVAALTWNDSAPSLRENGLPVKFMKPKEGALTWVCGLVLIKDAPQLDKAYDILDALLDPRAGAYLITEYAYGHSNQKTFDLVTDEQLAKAELPRDPATLLNSGYFFSIPDNYEAIVRMFEEVKAGF